MSVTHVQGGRYSVDDQTRSTRAGRALSVEDMLADAVEAFRIVASDRTLCRRMADAETSCALHVTDLDRGLTAYLDRDPIEVSDQVLEARSRIYGPAQAWVPVFRNGNLGIAVARGDLRYEGAVREFLRVFPILRTAYRNVARERGSDAVMGEQG